MHAHAFLVPGAERACESDDAEASTRHAGREHRRLGHADNRDVEYLSRRHQAGVAKGRDDGRVRGAVVFRQHFKRDGAADLRFGAR